MHTLLDLRGNIPSFIHISDGKLHDVHPSTGNAGAITPTRTYKSAGFYTRQDYPELLRRIRFKDPSGKTLVFITNNFSLPAATICALYKSRWQVELFFKWIKQHLRIKQFYGTSENAVKTQIWIAVSVYVLAPSSRSASTWTPRSTLCYRSSR